MTLTQGTVNWNAEQGLPTSTSLSQVHQKLTNLEMCHPTSNFAAGVILDSVGSLHGATELTGSHDVTTPIIDQITAQQIAGSAMFGTVENMQRGGQERRPAKSSLSQVKYRFQGYFDFLYYPVMDYFHLKWQDNTRNLLAAFLWVVKNVDNSVLKNW